MQWCTSIHENNTDSTGAVGMKYIMAYMHTPSNIGTGTTYTVCSTSAYCVSFGPLCQRVFSRNLARVPVPHAA